MRITDQDRALRSVLPGDRHVARIRRALAEVLVAQSSTESWAELLGSQIASTDPNDTESIDGLLVGLENALRVLIEQKLESQRRMAENDAIGDRAGAA